MSSPYKNEQGVYYTKSLFFETIGNPAERDHVIYTLKADDHNGLRSLRRLYLEEMDPTEYRFANKYLGGWDHWKKFLEANWFKAHIDVWREELELKLKSIAYERIMAEANDDLSKNKILANKYIVETLRRIQKNEDLGEKNTKGRPDKAAVDKKAFELALSHDNISKDAERILTGKELN